MCRGHGGQQQSDAVDANAWQQTTRRETGRPQPGYRTRHTDRQTDRQRAVSRHNYKAARAGQSVWPSHPRATLAAIQTSRRQSGRETQRKTQVRAHRQTSSTQRSSDQKPQLRNSLVFGVASTKERVLEGHTFITISTQWHVCITAQHILPYAHTHTYAQRYPHDSARGQQGRNRSSKHSSVAIPSHSHPLPSSSVSRPPAVPGHTLAPGCR